MAWIKRHKVWSAIIAVIVIAIISSASGGGKKDKTASSGSSPSPSAAAPSPTREVPTTAAPVVTQAPPVATKAAPTSRVVATFKGTGDKTSKQFNVGDTWLLSWTVRADTTPNVEVSDSDGNSITSVDTGKSGKGQTYVREACACHIKVSVFGDTRYTFVVTNLPGGIPNKAAPTTFSGTGTQATADFHVDGPWTLSWTVRADTTPTVAVVDSDGNHVDDVDTGKSGSGSTVEYDDCSSCHLEVEVFGETNYTFTIKTGS